MATRDFYAVLSVDRSATAEQIKAAYRRLALKLHPDVNGGTTDLGTHFKEVGEAFATLSDPDKRAAYDTKLHRELQVPPVVPVMTLWFATGGEHVVTAEVTNVGRADLAQKWHPELDLVPFGGAAPNCGVSRHQARIQRRGATYSITDMGSTNGTYVNGKELVGNQRLDLHHGDHIAFGALQATVTIR